MLSGGYFFTREKTTSNFMNVPHVRPVGISEFERAGELRDQIKELKRIALY